jgi:hypothetical protein
MESVYSAAANTSIQLLYLRSHTSLKNIYYTNARTFDGFLLYPFSFGSKEKFEIKYCDCTLRI